MTRITVLPALISGVLVAVAPAYSQSVVGDCAECKQVLAGGVFNTTNISQTQSAKSAFSAWQCSTEFKTHDEAISAGVSLGVPVYGVPLNIGGTYTDNQRSQWKSENCSASTSSAQSFQLRVIAMREAAPTILAAWTKCIETVCGSNRDALGCSIASTSGGGIFKAKWIRNVGDSKPPRVVYFKAYDATCSPAITPKSIVPEGGITVNCQVPVNKEAVLILQTDRGTCTPTLTGVASIETIAGRVVLSSDRNYKAEKILFSSDAVVVTNGHRLTFDANEIAFQGAPKIVSFDPSASNGAPAGTVLIKAQKLSGTSLIINNIGQPGAKGNAGGSAPKGLRGGKGTERDWNVVNGCIGGSNGGQGVRGGDGSDGSSGGTGGNGGAVIYDVGYGLNDGAIVRLVINTAGGDGGEGGDPGAAGPGGDGGEGANGTKVCGGTGPGPLGPDGNPGRKGPSGARGAPGQIVNYKM